jgi:uncharacterized protein (TIGR02145 family)
MKHLKPKFLAIALFCWGLTGLQAQIFTDTRDGHNYKWVKIGDQFWMAENLAYLPTVNPTYSESYTEPYYYVYDYGGTNVSEAKATSNFTTYGVLYNWPAIMSGAASSSSNPSGVQGICPVGWHLPSDAEWTELTDFLGGDTIAGGKLKESTLQYWKWPNDGAYNSTGFTALPGGSRVVGGAEDEIGYFGYWWSATEDGTNARMLVMGYNHRGAGHGIRQKAEGNSVRCLRDISDAVPVANFTASSTSITEGQNVQFTDLSTNGPTGWSWSFGDGGTSSVQDPSYIYFFAGTYTVTLTVSNSFGTDSVTKTGFINVSPSNDDTIIFNPNLTYGTMSDTVGNTYKTIQICNQSWMAENLKTTKYSDGTDIPLVKDSIAWADSSTAGYCWYNNEIANKNAYGALYNFYALETGKLCPEDWHVPTEEEWTVLFDCLGGKSIAGSKLKEADYAHWQQPNMGATNESGFTALPGGLRGSSGFFDIHYGGVWWSSSVNRFYFYLNYDIDSIGTSNSGKRSGYSVRCLKDNNISMTNSINSEEVIFYPNPATDGLYLKNNNYANSIMLIYDLEGKQILSKQIDSNLIDISNLEKGIYVVKLVDSKKVLITKFIKE